ncbi:MAG: hypothetical protein KDD25_10420 [Bdellovibrionales bacterium]|nr:hypothetical protein [Bdellovibrionales bacterium]
MKTLFFAFMLVSMISTLTYAGPHQSFPCVGNGTVRITSNTETWALGSRNLAVSGPDCQAQVLELIDLTCDGFPNYSAVSGSFRFLGPGGTKRFDVSGICASVIVQRRN